MPPGCGSGPLFTRQLRGNILHYAVGFPSFGGVSAIVDEVLSKPEEVFTATATSPPLCPLPSVIAHYCLDIPLHIALQVSLPQALKIVEQLLQAQLNGASPS
jgi:hypothetical protein